MAQMQHESSSPWQVAVATPLPGSSETQQTSNTAPSAKERLQNLQGEVNELKRKEAELRSLLAEVAGTAADTFIAGLAVSKADELPSRDILELVQEYGFIQGARTFAQCLQELQGVLKHLERQLRAVERAANAGDLNTFLISVSEAVASHNTVAENCEKLAQLPASGLPQLLRQHADSAVSRATIDQEKLLASLRRVLQKQLKHLGWPPPLALPSTTSLTQSQSGTLFESSSNWKGFPASDKEAVDWLVRLLAALVALQRSVQRSSFELGLNSSAIDPPALWAVEELAAPLAERLQLHFVGNPNTDRIDHPEWLFRTVKKIASSLAPQLTVLTPSLSAHELQTSYHIPFEFVRALRTALQGILRRHTLPRLAAAGQANLWLNFVEKAVAFEQELAPLWGAPPAEHSDDTPEIWRRGSCIATIYAIQEFREAWWEAEKDDAGQQFHDVLYSASAWLPLDKAWGETLRNEWEDISDPTSGSRQSEAWKAEFWVPQVSDFALTLVTQLAKKAAWLPEEAVDGYARAVPQEILLRLRKYMSSELKRLEEFREELSHEGVTKLGSMLCGAHHLEHSLREASGPLLLLESTGDNSSPESSMLSEEADAFGTFKQRGTLRLSKVVLDSFRQASGSYFRKTNIQSFSAQQLPNYREGVLSIGLRKGIEDLQGNLNKLSQVLDSVLFRDMWKGLAAALNRLFFNALITEALFSQQGAQQLYTDVSAITDVFLQFTNKPAAHFREVTEAARLLAAEEPLAAEAARQLGAGPSDQMAAALQPLGIVRLTPQQAAHVLAQRV